MSTIYDRGRALAIRQLAPISQGGKGQVATLTFPAVGEGGYDPATGVYTPPGPVVQTVSGVEKAIRIDRVNGSTILSGDSEFVMSPVQTNGQDLDLPDELPAQATLTLANGTVKQVASHDPKRPSGLLISATLQLRGAG